MQTPDPQVGWDRESAAERWAAVADREGAVHALEEQLAECRVRERSLKRALERAWMELRFALRRARAPQGKG